MRIASLTILCLALAAVSASAQVLYDNGPINGTEMPGPSISATSSTTHSPC
jgi:hypothetical protein